MAEKQKNLFITDDMCRHHNGPHSFVNIDLVHRQMLQAREHTAVLDDIHTTNDVNAAADIEMFAPKHSGICVVIGVLNEGERIQNQLIAMQPYREDIDIILADGCSHDGSLNKEFIHDKVRGIIRSNKRPSLLSSQYSDAMQFALNEGYENIIMMDGNNKDGPQALPEFVHTLEQGYDFVQGSRFLTGGMHENTPFLRVLGMRFIFNPIMRLASGYAYTDAINGFKAFSRRYLLDSHLKPFHDRYYCYGLQYYLTYSAKRLGYKVTEIPVVRVYPKAQPVPTKIHGIKGWFLILWELVRTISGVYSPKNK